MSEHEEDRRTTARRGLLARALDPDSGALERHEGDPEACCNCGTALVGAYCHACGQPVHIHRTIGGFMHDLLHGALHFEGTFWRTLPVLALRPGKLTRSYIDGARARFVSPMALFLFSVFLLFAVSQILAAMGGTEGTATDAPPAAESLSEGEDGRQVIALDSAGNSRISIKETGIGWFDNGVGHKWRENPDLMLYKLKANSYKFSWLLVPISIPFVWLLFAWKRRFGVYDHAIFVTYSLSFMTLLFVAIMLLEAVGVPSALLLLPAMLVPPVHIYKQLRGTYALSRLSAAWRLLVLLALILVIGGIFLQVLVMLGAF